MLLFLFCNGGVKWRDEVRGWEEMREGGGGGGG